MQTSGFAIIRDSKGNVLLANSGVEYLGAPRLMVFGGMSDGDEDPRAALLRELREEICFDEANQEFLEAVLSGDTNRIEKAKTHIIERITKDHEDRIAKATEEKRSLVIQERDKLIEAVTSRLNLISENRQSENMRSDIETALSCHEQALDLIARLEGQMNQWIKVHEETFVPSPEQFAKGWVQDRGDYFEFSLTDPDFDIFEEAIRRKIG